MYDLNVCIASRDRTFLTEKCIDSIHENSPNFRNINIYLFDNLSVIDEERNSFVARLLNQRKICYYSYDTSVSSNECFPKAVAFKRWTYMMNEKEYVKKHFRLDPNFKNIYVLCDNDFLFGKCWDEYFISALEFIWNNEDIKFLVKFPGGIPMSHRTNPEKIQIKNRFNKENFEFFTASMGGASGFWFMNHRMLESLWWSHKELTATYKAFKKHDSETWKRLRKSPENKNKKYVGAVIPNEPNTKPLILHLGSVFGSICNSETNSKYKNEYKTFKEREMMIKDLSSSELFEKYKHLNTW